MTAVYDDAVAESAMPDLLPLVQLTPNGRTVLEMRYLQEGETPELRFYRVARHIAQAEARFGGDVDYWTTRFYERLAALHFLPNSPTLFNAGTVHGGCLSGCFFLSIKDSMEGILHAHAQAAWTLKSGGGVGFDFSKLRPRGTGIGSTHKGACGPVPVMAMMSQLSETFTQGAGAKRTGALMATLRVDHPDIERFIRCKDDGKSIVHANISVLATSSFMEAVAGERRGHCPRGASCHHFDLVWQGLVFKTVDARDLWQEIAASAWKTGDPGVIFIDRANGAANPISHVTEILGSNPCGEVLLEPYGSCNLGSVDVSKFVCPDYAGGEEFDWFALGDCVADLMRFLDNVIEVNEMPTPEMAAANQRTRRAGLGVMGWADALAALRIPYDSDRALELAGRLMWVVQDAADRASLRLGGERGTYGVWEGSDHWREGKRYRNSFRTTIAPTGSIAILAGCSSGIEPHFALEWTHYTEQEVLEVQVPAYRQWLQERRVSPVAADYAPSGRPDWLVTAMEIDPYWHVRHQAAFQAHVNNSISKSINMPNTATVADIKMAYQLAYDTGCKGVTVFRDGCRDQQVLVAKITQTCPECGKDAAVQEGCVTCPACGYSACSV